MIIRDAMLLNQYRLEAMRHTTTQLFSRGI